MPVTIKKSQLLYKDASTGNYVGVDAVADKTSEQQINGIQIAANNAISAINDALDDISTEPLTELPKKAYKNDLTTNAESLGSSASKAYSIGDYFYVSDNENDRSLYKVTADIASGDTISAGTAASNNCIPAALAEDVNALSNDLENIEDAVGAYSQFYNSLLLYENNISLLIWGIGGINNSTGVSTGGTVSVRTNNFLYIAPGSKISVPDGYLLSVYEYTNKQNTSYTHNYVERVSEYTAIYEIYVRILVEYSDGRSVTDTTLADVIVFNTFAPDDTIKANTDQAIEQFSGILTETEDNSLTWALGSINPTTGSSTNSSIAIRCNDFVYLNAGDKVFVENKSYKICAYYYKEATNSSFTGASTYGKYCVIKNDTYCRFTIMHVNETVIDSANVPEITASLKYLKNKFADVPEKTKQFDEILLTDEDNNLTWAIGGINQTTGSSTTSTISIRSNNFMFLYPGDEVRINSDEYLIKAFYYNDFYNNTFDHAETNYKKYIVIKEVTYCRFVIMHVDGITIAEENVSAISALVKIKRNNLEGLKNEITSQINGLWKVYKTIGVIGDSLASGACYYRNSSGTLLSIQDYEQSWIQFMARESGRVAKNFSVGGLTTERWLTDSHGYPLASLVENKCDAYYIGLGVNDKGFIEQGTMQLGTIVDIKTDPSENANTYYGNYGKIIQLMTAYNPKAVFFLITNPRDDVNGYINTAIREIAAYFSNAYLIDLTKYRKEYTDDNYLIKKSQRSSHYNSPAYQAMAQIIAHETDVVMNENYITKFIDVDYNYSN